MIRPCRHCGYDTRPQGTSVEEYPETKARLGRDLCGTCYPKHRDEYPVLKPPVADLKLCLGDCGRLVRPKRTTVAEHPGTVGVAARGRCGSCYDTDRRARRAVQKLAPVVPMEPPVVSFGSVIDLQGPNTNGHYVARCRRCDRWARRSASDTHLRGLAYQHAATHIENQEEE